jgi:hypothetical protein
MACAETISDEIHVKSKSKVKYENIMRLVDGEASMCGRNRGHHMAGNFRNMAIRKRQVLIS